MIRGEMGVYQITCIPTGKIYIGSSVNLGHRWISHQSDLNLNQHGNSYLQRAWNKYGETSFKCGVLQPVLNKENLLLIEERWIRLKDSTNPEIGFNLTDCTITPMKGKHHTEETKAKISRRGKGRKLSDRTRQRMSEARKGRGLTPEAIVKAIATKRANGYKLSPEHLAKFLEGGRKAHRWNKGLPKELNPLTGVPRSKEVNHKISLSNKGRFWGQGDKAKKPVSGYSPDGTKVLEFESTASAVRAGYTNMSRAIKFKQKVNGLYWMFSEIPFDEYMDSPKQSQNKGEPRPKSPYLDTETGIFYDSCRELAKAFCEDPAKIGRDIRKGKYGTRFLRLE